MKTMQKKERAMGLTMAVLMSVSMGAIATYLVLQTNSRAAASTPAPVMYASNIALSILLGVIIAVVIPLGRLGKALARKMNANPPGIGFTLLNAIPLSIGNSVLIGLALSFVGVFTARSHIPAEQLAHMPPLVVMWLSSWVQLLLPTLIASYVIAVLLSPIVSSIVGLNRPLDDAE